jgi:hypothetical protein
MNAIFRIIRPCIACRFWASPHFYAEMVLPARNFNAERMLSQLKVYDPGFPRDDPSDEPGTPSPSFPTDVPAPEPHDVPAPQPMDDPPPDPGETPSPTSPPKRPQQDPQPRPIP